MYHKLKTPNTLKLGHYSDDWNGCNKLINDLLRYSLDCQNFSKNKGGVKRIGNFIKVHLDDNTKINPAFYPLIENYLAWIGWKRIAIGAFKNLYDFLSSNRGEQETMIDNKNVSWVNINNIYPKYENKGTIAINRLDTQTRMGSGDKLFKIKDNSVHKWSADIANILNILDEFSGGQIDFEPHQKRAIKYIIGEVLANTFQHAFKNEGASSLGIFIDKNNYNVFITISDRGTSIPINVRKYKKEFKKRNDSWCIEWALEEGNTTKNELKQGGMGLFRTKKIIESAKGNFAVRSYGGMYFNSAGNVKKSHNIFKTIGTIFYAKFNLKDIIKETVEIDAKTKMKTRGIFRND